MSLALVGSSSPDLEYIAFMAEERVRELTSQLKAVTDERDRLLAEQMKHRPAAAAHDAIYRIEEKVNALELRVSRELADNVVPLLLALRGLRSEG